MPDSKQVVLRLRQGHRIKADLIERFRKPWRVSGAVPPPLSAYADAALASLQYARYRISCRVTL
jgi:hypothetical protein